MQQLPLDLGHRTAMAREDFLIAPSNQDAVAWIDLWPEWPAPLLVLYGPVASGKSHLAAVWQTLSKASYLNAADLNDKTARCLADTSNHMIIEDADHLIGSVEGEKGLFHLYNIAKEEKRSILLTMTQAPIHRAFTLPDLASRLRAAPSVAIREPDDQLLSAVLVKLFNDRQLRLNADVLHYIIPRIERSFEAARELVDKADKLALQNRQAISIPLMRQILSE